MTAYWAFGLVALVGVLTSIALAVSLHPLLSRLLGELCGSTARADFWVRVSLLWIVLVTVLAATATFGYPDTGGASATQVFLGALTQVRFLLAGLLGSIVALAVGLLWLVRRFDERATPPRVTWGHDLSPSTQQPPAA